jgi:hypothetical protein
LIDAGTSAATAAFAPGVAGAPVEVELDAEDALELLDDELLLLPHPAKAPTQMTAIALASKLLLKRIFLLSVGPSFVAAG